MGYTTDFEGRFNLDRKLDDDTFDFLTKFNDTRRMKRNVDAEYGVEGEFYVDGEGDFGQDESNDIIDYNMPPSTQPGLWCQWCPTDDREGIEWDGNEKFYAYLEWLNYIIKNFLAPKGYVLNGEVSWEGEERTDTGVIRVLNNKVTTY